MQINENPACTKSNRTYNQKRILESLMHIARPRIAAAEKVKQQRAQCNAETDGQLLVYRHQAVAAAFHLRPQIG